MSPRPSLPPSTPANGQSFGRRASDRGFAQSGQWFGRRMTDLKVRVRHSLPFAAQVAAQIAPEGEKTEAAPPYAGRGFLRAGLVKDFKA